MTLVAALALNNLWQSLALAALFALVLTVGLRLSARVRHRLALAAFFGAALLPLAVLAPAPAFTSKAPAPVSSSTAPAPDRLATTLPATSFASSARRAPAPAGAGVDMAALLVRAAASVWAAGALVLLARLMADLAASGRLRRSGRRVAAPAILGEAAPGCEILKSAAAPGPMVVGVFNPAIVCPPGWMDEVSGTDLRAILEHERCHIERGDVALALVQRIMLALYWWNPAMHWLGARLAAEREMACDEMASQRLGDGRLLARAIAAQAERQGFLPARLVAVGAAFPSAGLAERVRRLAGRTGRPSRAAGRAFSAALALALVFMALSTPRLSAQPPAPKPAAPAAKTRTPAPAPAARAPRPTAPAAAKSAAPTAAAVALALPPGAAAIPAPAPYDAGSPLHIAARRGDTRVAELLLRAGADLDARDSDGWTPLMVAISAGNVPFARVLLEGGADVRASDGRGNTALLLAARGGDPALIQELLSQGAEVDAKNSSGSTPLTTAINAQKTAAVELLIAGADVNGGRR